MTVTPQTTVENTTANAVKQGVKTSEFWVTVLTLALYFALTLMPADVVNKWAESHGWIGGLVAAAYVAARAYVKGNMVK